MQELGVDVHKAGPREHRPRGVLDREESYQRVSQHQFSRNMTSVATYSAAVWESSDARDCWEKLLLRPVTRSAFVSAMDGGSTAGGGGESPDMITSTGDGKIDEKAANNGMDEIKR